MGLGVRGLREFGLTLGGLAALGQAQVDVEVALSPKMYDKRLVRLPFDARLALFKALKKRSVAHILKVWPTKPISFHGHPDFPHSFRSTVAAHLIPALARDREIDSIELVRIPGLRRRRPKAPRTLSWYAVRALVAVEVEGQLRGMQLIEDRIVLVRAYSDSDAHRRLSAQWKQYEGPGLGEDGYLRRWKMQKIVDTYELIDSRIDPRGTEVYSTLGRRRMKPEYVWQPFKPSNNRLQRAGDD